ncbi:MAG: peptidylprolyl isomerase [Candidatus Omnitrophica bacterium]|nr:peptidylprolyl isomerase [Candidatus Omnitrophota bacterium]
MKLTKFVFLIITCLIICSGEIARAAEKIVAVIGNELITLSELEEALTPVYKQYKALFKGAELEAKSKKAREEILAQMIKDKVILQEAGKLGVTIREEDVDDKLNEMIAKFPSEEKFFAALKNEGIALESIRIKYREQLIIRKLTNMEVRAKVALRPQELMDYYNDNKKEFTEVEEVKLKTILIRVEEDGSDEAARTRMEEIRTMLLEGMDFGRLALVTSEGPEAKIKGDIGFVKRGELLEEVDKVIFKLQPGEISEPIRTEIGYHLFKVEVKKESRVKEFKEVRRYIEDKLFQQKAVTRFNEWISKLEEDVYISVK